MFGFEVVDFPTWGTAYRAETEVVERVFFHDGTFLIDEDQQRGLAKKASTAAGFFALQVGLEPTTP
jgi:hypothetical protein